MPIIVADTDGFAMLRVMSQPVQLDRWTRLTTPADATARVIRARTRSAEVKGEKGISSHHTAKHTSATVILMANSYSSESLCYSQICNNYRTDSALCGDLFRRHPNGHIAEFCLRTLPIRECTQTEFRNFYGRIL